jgi:hypothetical protein
LSGVKGVGLGVELGVKGVIVVGLGVKGVIVVIANGVG